MANSTRTDAEWRAMAAAALRQPAPATPPDPLDPTAIVRSARSTEPSLAFRDAPPPAWRARNVNPFGEEEC